MQLSFFDNGDDLRWGHNLGRDGEMLKGLNGERVKGLKG